MQNRCNWGRSSNHTTYNHTATTINEIEPRSLFKQQMNAFIEKTEKYIN